MGYRNNNIGYREGLLETRAIVEKNNYAVLVHDGLVKNVIPGFEKDFEISILSSKELGASFVDYIGTALPGAKNERGFGGEGVETFIYVTEGELTVADKSESHDLTKGGYVFLPASELMYMENKSSEKAEFYLYKRRYEALEGYEAKKVVNHIDNIEPYEYEDMKDVLLWDLLPLNDLGYDMNMHILSFGPGGCHGFVETHYQEHGAYMLSGRGMYLLDNTWMPVEKGDYIFMSRYVKQCAYGIGRHGEPFSYIYSKDCNRDPQI